MLQHTKMLKRTLPGILILLAFGLSAFGPGPTPTPESVPEPIFNSNIVVAEGRVLPVQYANIAFTRGGEVMEILVKEGTLLKKGEPIARLKADKSLEAGLTMAQQDLLDAQQGLDDVKKDEDVDRATALQAVADATDALRKAKSMSYYYTVPSRVAIFSMFEAADKMQEKLDAARKAYEPFRDVMLDSRGMSDLPATFCMPASLCRGTFLPADHSPARDLRDDLSDAEGDLAIALTQIRNASRLALAQASYDKAQKDSQKLEKGPDPDKLVVAETKLKKAQYQLEEANKRIQDLELRAPFDGTIAKIDLKVGEQVTAGKSVAQFADFSRWVVETDNLTEIQVVKIDEGQAAEIKADAYPDETFKGVVDKISKTYEDKDGDVTYLVRIALPDASPKLRWGMTVVATLGQP